MAFVVACLLLAGCAARRTDLFYRYQIASNYADDVLFPPAGYTDASSGDVLLRLNAASRCDVPAGTFRLKRRGRHSEVAIRKTALDFTGRIPVELLKDFGVFRSELARCGSDEALARLVAERLALPSQVLVHLCYGSFAHLGFIDLVTNFRLRVVSPSAGAVEFATYEIRPDRGRLRLTLTAVETSVQGKVQPSARPRDGYLLGVSGVCLRLFLLTRVSSSDHDVAILEATSPEAMERATEAFEARPEGCAKMPGCVPVPKGVAVMPEVRVRVQGRPVFIPLGATVRSALAAAGEETPARVTSRLRILRPFDGRLVPVRFDATESAILRLSLVGGEELTW